MSLHDEESLENRYLIFEMASELYGAPLLQVREVLRNPRICPVPFTVEHFKGIVNLRGQILSMVDLRQRFQMPPSRSDTQFALMVHCDRDRMMGALVDQLRQVIELEESQIQKNAEVQSRIPREHLRGIAKNGDELVHIIDLAGILTQYDYRKPSAHREAA